jgi:hypothetical protein
VAALQQAIHNKQVLRQQPEPYSDLKSDSQSDDEVESISKTSSQHSDENVLQPFGYQELISNGAHLASLFLIRSIKTEQKFYWEMRQ